MRRQTMLFALVALASLLGPAGGQSMPVTQPSPAAFRFAAITDTHIAQPAELARFRRFLCTIQDRKVDFLLILGDLCGHAPEYLPQIHDVIERSGLSVYAIPGNHDDNYGKNPEWFDAAFPPYFAFDHKGWHFVMSDSQIPPPAEWLNREFQNAGQKPIVFCQHYPPTLKQTADTLPWSELAKHSNTSLVLVGHEHRRRTGKIGTVGYEVLANCFMKGEPNSGHYYIINAYPQGTTQIQEFSLDDLSLREPSDHVPTVAVQLPHDGDILRNGTVFAGTASDDKGLKRVEYSVDFGRWQPAEGTKSWKFRMDTGSLKDGHHLFRVRAIDSADQSCIELGTVLALVENHPPPSDRVFRLQQGVNGYDGCCDVTVRRHGESKDPGGEEGEASDLECWTGKDGRSEFNEFYIRFDLAKVAVPKDAKIKRATLTLYGSRQNQVDTEGKLCKYYVGLPQEPWTPDLTFATRPGKPGWLSPTEPPSSAVLAMAWPYLGGRQILIPPQPIVIDLIPMLETLQQWLRDPSSNCGLVFSPAGGRPYNMSAKGSRFRLATLRPKLEIEIEGTAR